MQCDLPRLVGSLLHITKNSRPDIEAAVSCVARYTSRPSTEIINAALRIVDYLQSTPHLGTHIRPHNNQHIEAYVDSSYITEKSIHGCSRYGYVIYINGTPIVTRTMHHNTSSFSTTEAEYIALGMTHRTIQPLNHFYAEILNLPHNKSTFANNLHVHIHEDNKPCINVLERKSLQNTKLRNVLAYQFNLRQDFDDKALTVSLCPTTEQLADIFTKATQSRSQFANIRNFLVRPIDDTHPTEFRDNNHNTSALSRTFTNMFTAPTNTPSDSDEVGGYDAGFSPSSISS